MPLIAGIGTGFLMGSDTFSKIKIIEYSAWRSYKRNYCTVKSKEKKTGYSILICIHILILLGKICNSNANNLSIENAHRGRVTEYYEHAQSLPKVLFSCSDNQRGKRDNCFYWLSNDVHKDSLCHTHTRLENLSIAMSKLASPD